MSSREDYEDADIDGLSERSWFGSCLRGVLFGAVLFVVGVVALSLSNPLPEHLPGVGKVEIVRNDATTTPKPADAPAEQPATDNTETSAATSDADDGAQPAETEPTTPAATPEQPATGTDADTTGQDQPAPSQDQQTVTAAAPAEPKTPAAPQPEETTAPATPEQPVATQPVQPSVDPDNELTDGGANDVGSAQPQLDQNTTEVSETPSSDAPSSDAPVQPEDTINSTDTEDQQIAAVSPAQPERPIPEINLPGRALDVNARPFEAPQGAALLAVVLQDASGATIKADALPLMTMPLTFAIPSGAGNRVFAEQARAAGHEVLAQLPMAKDETQASDFAKGQPAGLLSAEAARHMAELDMAIGATAPHEAPLLRDQDGMTAVMDPLGPHGFIWLDPRQGIGSAAKGVAALQEMTWSAGDRYVDGPADEDRIYQNLESAAAVARRNGSSIVFLDASPDALKALVRWGLNRGGKAVWFAPVSAVVKLRQSR